MSNLSVAALAVISRFYHFGTNMPDGETIHACSLPMDSVDAVVVSELVKLQLAEVEDHYGEKRLHFTQAGIDETFRLYSSGELDVD